MNLLNRRRLFGSKKQKTLPYDCEVEYIEFNKERSGPIKITADYIPQGGDIDIELEFMPIAFSGKEYDSYFMSYVAANTQAYLMHSYGNNNNAVNIRNGNISSTDTKNIPINVGEKNFLRMEGVARKYKLNNIEGSLKAASSIKNTSPIKIIGSIEENPNCAYYRLYYFKLWKAGDLILDLIPVRKDNIGYLYNKVTGKLLDNVGTGKFILGPNVTMPYDAEVEYLETTREDGRAYIDTEYIPNGDDIDFYATFMPIDYVGNYCHWFGNPNNSDKTNKIYRVSRYGTTNDRVCVLNNISQGRYITIGGISLNEKYEISVLHDGNVSFNEIKGTITNMGSGDLNDTSFRLFSSLPSNYTFGRLYSFRLDKAGVTQLDLIPVRKGNVGYLYDKVSGNMYGNNGDGKFIIGPDKPYDAEIEYLECNQTDEYCCIPTDYKPMGLDNICKVKFMMLLPNSGVQNSGTLFINSGGTTSRAIYRIQTSSDGYILYTMGSAPTANKNIKKDIEYNTIIDAEMSSTNILINGVSNQLVTSLGKNEESFISLFNSSITNLPSANSCSRIYYFKWEKDGETILDLIPVRKGDEGYLYDKVSGRLLGNIGSGHLVLGPDIN